MMRIRNHPILAWCLYDAGNSAFATTIMAVIFPVFFQKIAAAPLTPSLATAYWGYASSLGLLISAMAAPFLGSIADGQAIRKFILVLCTAVGALASMAMGLVGPGNWPLALTLLVVGSVGFSGASVCYDSLLPHLVPQAQLDQVSSAGYAMGYLGGGTLLGLNLITMTLLPGLPGVQLSFVSVGLWWLAFTFPLAIAVPEPPRNRDGSRSLGDAVRSLRQTFREIRRYRDAFTFLVAFWLYNDGIGTVIRMAAIFGAQVGIASRTLISALLVTQFVGIPCALLLGHIAKKIGSKKTLSVALIWYLVVAGGAYAMTKRWHFWALAIAVGAVQGGAQAISRSLYASMLPPSRSAEFFGLYDVSSKFAGILGPAAFGVITQITGSPRTAILAVGSTFLAGLVLLAFVDVDRGRQWGVVKVTDED